MVTAVTSTAQDYALARRLPALRAGVLYDRRLTELVGGNMSLRVGEVRIVTPTKASENDGWRLAAEDLLVQDLAGNVLEGDPRRVSREIRLHLRLYSTFPEIGCVLHLHLPEAIAAAASGRWGWGVVAAAPEPFGAALVVLEPGLRAQTEPHDGRVVDLLGRVERAAGAISISPGHGIFGVARDVPTAVRAADVFRQRLELERVRHRLRAAAGRGRP
jgi:ribulose-5-phosphate 4-epimerase/fuculose-1-phosphate aldolase